MTANAHPSPSIPVRIEPISLRWARAVQALASDPAIGATSNVPWPYPPDGAVTWISHAARAHAAGSEATYAVIAGETFVGACGVLSIGGEPRSGELGYWIGRPHWGRGYATAAARLVVDRVFEEHGVVRLVSSCLERNPASFRVLIKTGFRHTGFTCYPHLKWGPRERFATFALTREEWAATRR